MRNLPKKETTKMIEKLVIDNKELMVILTIEDNEYGKVKKCFQRKNKVYVIDNQIVTDQKTIKILNDRYEVKIPEEWTHKN